MSKRYARYQVSFYLWLFGSVLHYQKCQNIMTRIVNEKDKSLLIMYLTPKIYKEPTGAHFITGLQKLGARLGVCTYRAPKTLMRYTKKRAPKINSDVCFTKIL